VLLGALEAQEGRITFRNQRWNLVSGAARFVDPRHTEMILDVTGQSRIKDYDVTLRLAGRPDELSVTLSSSPALPQDELLSWWPGHHEAQRPANRRGAVVGEMVRLLAADLLGITMGGLGPDQISMEKTDTNQQIVHVGGQLDRGCPDALLAEHLRDREARAPGRIPEWSARCSWRASRTSRGALGAISCCGCDSDEAAHPAISRLRPHSPSSQPRPPPFSAIPPEIVKGVDLVSAQELPTELVRAAIGELADRPRSRAAIRESLERLWSLGLFSESW